MVAARNTARIAILSTLENCHEFTTRLVVAVASIPDVPDLN
jgi:hypothetical protein